MAFELRALPYPTDGEKALYFVFRADKLLLEIKNDSINILDTFRLSTYHIKSADNLYLGRLDSVPCFAGSLNSYESASDSLKLIGLRQLYDILDEQIFWLAARAFHLSNWSRNNQFCGRCGEKTSNKGMEHTKHCSNCGLDIYPKISPAIIVAITKGDKLLLAKNAQRKTCFYSVIAGFAEPGENLEDCVNREIKEEVGIEVKNVKYFGSQPWPFPDSLMVGYTAEYDKGELILDNKELSDAQWFSADELPEIPSNISISRKLINWFVNNNKK